MNRHTLPALLLTALAIQSGSAANAAFEADEDALGFVREMTEKHGFEREALLDALKRAHHQPDVIRLITPPKSTGARSWKRYQARFLDDLRIDGGLSFWREHHETLEAASTRFGVPPEIIVAIIGVETHYGSYTGNFETVSALATLAFDYPPRAELFRKELENLFLLAREQNRDPFDYAGSFAGALGYPQFLPSSIRNHAVDFDGDGRIDFDSDPIDAIGSVANYLAAHGWVAGAPVAVRVHLPENVDAADLVAAGIYPTIAAERVTSLGMIPLGGDLHASDATLVDLVTPGERTEYWLGYQNFYAITRYNRSSFYAMSVHQLAQALRSGYLGPNAAR